MYRITLLPAFLSVFVAGLLAAQESRPLQPGDRIRLSSPQHSGTAAFVELASDTLVLLRPGDGTRLSVPVTSIRRFAVSRGPRSKDVAMREAAGALGIVGGMTGLVVGMASVDSSPRCREIQSCSDWGCSQGMSCGPAETTLQKGWQRSWQLGLTGAAVGALIGAARPGETWQQLRLPHGTTMASSGDGRVSAGFSFSF
jgi:hypothetical protein